MILHKRLTLRRFVLGSIIVVMVIVAALQANLCAQGLTRQECIKYITKHIEPSIFGCEHCMCFLRFGLESMFKEQKSVNSDVFNELMIMVKSQHEQCKGLDTSNHWDC